MDVGNPSNFARIVDLYDNDLRAIRHDIWGCSFSDEETLRAMHDVEQRHSYVLDPHTAVGVLGWQSFAKQNHATHAGDRSGHGASRQIRGNGRARHRRPARNAGTPRRISGPAEEIHSISQPICRASGISSILEHLILLTGTTGAT